MLALLLRRAVGAALVLIVTSFVTFALLSAAPGDAASTLAGEYAGQGEVAALRSKMHLDEPLVPRYLSFLDGMLHGDFGVSLINGRPVTDLVWGRFLQTLILAFAAAAVALLVGLFLGGLAAASRLRLLDLGLMALTSLGISLPVFWVAMVLSAVFSVRLHWLPVVGGGTPAHLVLPVVTLAAPTTALIARLTRASLRDVFCSDYVRTAYSKGATTSWVWRGHVLRNGLIPVVTMLALHFGQLLGGAFIVETLFGYPGLGRLTVQAIFDRDGPVVIAAVILVAVIYQALNLLSDLAHAWLDPRLRKEMV